MKDIAPQLRAWGRQGKRYALATLIKVERSAPRAPGAVMAVCEDGTVAGSVSGGCVESALHEEATAVIESGVPKTVSYGISDAEGWEVGLACGGQLHLLVDRPQLPNRLFDEIEAERPLAIATIASGEGAGGRLILWPEVLEGWRNTGAPVRVKGDSVAGAGFDSEELRSAVANDALELWSRHATDVRSYPQGDVFIQTFAPMPEMYVFGAADFSAAVASIGRFLGYHVSVIDPRSVFATKERFPDAHEVVVEWPDRFLAKAPIDASTAIVTLTHDPKFDIPALQQALKTDAGFIGAMGAKRTNEERFRRLREAGCTEEQLARIHAPVGLDLGGKSPQETAVSIAAQIIALRNNKLGR